MGTGHTTTITKRSDEAQRKPLQILHLERRREDSHLVRNALEAEGLACEILRVETREEFLAALKECRIDLVVADYFEPSLDGLTLLHRVGEQTPERPVIFLVADMSRQQADMTLRAGAAAVVLKSEAPKLVKAVRSALAQTESRAGKIYSETQLGETEQRLRKIAAGLGHSFWSVTADSGEFHFVSPEFEKFLALPRHHLGSHRFKLVEFVHNDDREQVAGALRQQARMGECQVEFRLAHPDGSGRWVWARIFPVFEGGVVIRLAGITEDITQRKSQEAKPQSTDDRWASVFRVFPDLFFLLDPDGTILDFQAGDVSDLLLRPDQFLGRRIQEVGTANVGAQFAEALGRTQRSGAAATFEYTLPVAGLRQHYEARCLPLPDRRVGAFVRNITDRKENEATLRESQRRISTLIDSLPGIVFSCANDDEGSLTYLSEGVFQATGYRREELLRDGGELFRSIINREDWPRVRDTIATALRSQQTYSVEYRVRNKAGLERWLWEQGRGLHDGQGELRGREGFITDVTDRRRAEEALRQQTDLLRGAAQSSQLLLTGLDDETATAEALATLGQAARADRVYLCENSLNDCGQLKLKPSVEWVREGVEASVSQAKFDNSTYAALGLKRWLQEFSGGNVVCGVLASFPPEESVWLEADGIQSVLLAPILIEGEMYGYLGLDSCTVERYWTAAEQSILTAAAAGFGGVLRSRRDKQALATAERRFREIFENSFEGIFQTSPEGRFLNANLALARIYGYDSPRALMEKITNIATQIFERPEDRERFRKEMEFHGEVRSFEYPVRRPDSRIIWVSENSRAVRTPEGKTRYYEGTLVDITARKQIEEALRDSEVLYHSLVENLPVFLFRKDTEGRITFVNERFCKLVSRPMTEVLGRTDDDLFPKVLADVYRAGDQQVMRTRRPLEAEEDQVTSDGRPLRIQVIKSAILDAKNNVIGVQGLFWDVTSRHDVEQQLRESNQRLESTLRELKHAQRQVVQQERLHALGQMSSGIAHDFNNTLMAILGFTELLLMHPETLDNKPKVISYLKTMSTAAQDAAVVVKRLNDFYRHREEGVVFPPADMAKLIQQVITLTQPRWKDQALASGVHIEVETDLQEVLPVAGHEGELRECLINILFNAVDAMPEGGTITVATRVEGEAVVLEFGDSGSGMTDEVRKRCFEPFFSTKGQRGTGLGLAMVFGIIQRHQGTIDIQSELGKGTKFIIRLPALRQDFNKGGDTELLGLPTQSLSVLVVDDEPLIRQILAEYLNADGHAVVTAVDGREALQRFTEKHFDLILTDRSMPHMSGDNLADAIKQVDPRKPVVLLTGFGDMMKATGQKPKGVDVVMAKPITLNGLRVCLAEAMGRN